MVCLTRKPKLLTTTLHLNIRCFNIPGPLSKTSLFLSFPAITFNDLTTVTFLNKYSVTEPDGPRLYFIFLAQNKLPALRLIKSKKDLSVSQDFIRPHCQPVHFIMTQSRVQSLMPLYYNLDWGLMKGQEAVLLNEIILAFSNGSAFR